MIKGGKVVCTRSDLVALDDMKFFTEGKEYKIQDVAMTSANQMGVVLHHDSGDLSIPLVMDGAFWTFELVAEESQVVEIGTVLKCTRDDSKSHAFIKGNQYTVVGIDKDGDYQMHNEHDFVSSYGCPLQGYLWDFEVVK